MYSADVIVMSVFNDEKLLAVMKVDSLHRNERTAIDMNRIPGAFDRHLLIIEAGICYSLRIRFSRTDRGDMTFIDPSPQIHRVPGLHISIRRVQRAGSHDVC